MKAIIRKDEQAVSPVIATILMVAITVVLAAVLYVMVSGLIGNPGAGSKPTVSLTQFNKLANGM
ncbi:MAG TPA: type IV pilin, partial [Thermoplasmata archaeon]|nr:type IV pilin [Thermoplasmata archaeon]